MPLVDISTVKPHPYNDKLYKDDDEQDEALRKSIEERGIQTPIVVNPSGYVISGNRRLRIAQLLGFDQVPVVERRFKDVDEEIEFLITSNLYRVKTKEELIREGKKLAEIALRRGPSNQRIRDEVGAQLGMSGRTFENGAKVVEKIDELNETDPEAAEKLRERLNKSVDGALKEVNGENTDDAEKQYQEAVQKVEKERTLFYLPALKELLRLMDATYVKLAPKRTATTPVSVGHMIGNLRDMTERLATWLPQNMVACSKCGGTGKVSAEDRNGNPVDVTCDTCINGQSGLYKESEN